MSTIDGSDYTSALNSLKLANANSLLGSAGSSGGVLSNDVIQQWSMLRANGKAYARLLQAQETGSVKQDKKYDDLLSDKLLNDYYTPADETNATSYTYKAPAATAEKTAADGDELSQLEAMRNLALAAITNPDSINDNYVNLFGQMQQNIAGGLVTSGSSSSSDSSATESRSAAAATLTANAGFRLLTDDETFTVAGKTGEKTYSFGAGTVMEDIASAINADSPATGVKAEVVMDENGNAASVKLTSSETGKDAFVRVDQIIGSLFANAGSSKSAAGTDAVKGSDEVVARGGDAAAAIATGIYGGKTTDVQEFTIKTAKGEYAFSFAAGATAGEIAEAVNAASETLGIQAELIRNSSGEVEGLGLKTSDLGDGNYIELTQNQGYLFTAPGKKVDVTGASENPSGANRVDSLSQLGRVTIDGRSYSFADLGYGGKASLTENPAAALSVLDQALRDIYTGAAQLEGVEIGGDSAAIVAGEDAETSNVLELNNWGSAAIQDWLNALKGAAT
ncbi:MAG: hypothetical protein LBT97_00075 [Planctomycetota bacterium]|jgi:hypothetical protein|nr:hypothetical protein [Planctomycetota bacterium]